MNPTPPRIGLLPFYLDLYDEVCARELTDDVKGFSSVIRAEFERRGVEALPLPVCSKREHFVSAMQAGEKADVDAIVSLHLAYSPSLEAIDAIAETDLPLIVLNTTPDYTFGFEQEKERIMFNHGIHGVQDFCNLLLRRGKPFSLEAGHWKESDAIDRAVSVLRACRAAKALRRSRVGIIGKPFKGMGDFAVPFDLLKRNIGIETITAGSEDIARLMPAPNSDEVKAETAKDLAAFTAGRYSEEALAASEAAGLGLRRWVEEERLSAVTVNFADITGAPGLPVVPFLEASKAMARGLGYAGEGDVLTAALCGALLQAAPKTTFTEMFCPDWEGNRIFMSHMGEINADLTAERPVLEQCAYPFSAAAEPVIAAGCLTPGSAWLINAAPGPDDSYSLIAAAVEVCDAGGKEKIDGGIRGWIKPITPVADFLRQYSLHGGTHHCVLSYGVDQRFVEAFAKALNWTFVNLGAVGATR